MRIVAGVDFGTLSVRVTLLDTERGRLGTASASYPLHRRRDDPDYATQSHDDHMTALVEAMRQVLADTGIDGDQIEAIALDTTGSSVIPVGARSQPLDDYYLWCDHRAARSRSRSPRSPTRASLEAIEWCGGVYSHEWGFAKLLHWLRHNPDKRAQFVTAFEHCDMVAATLCGITDPDAGQAQHLRHGPQVDVEPALGRLPSAGVPHRRRPAPRRRPRQDGRRRTLTSDHIAGHLSPEWAAKLGLTRRHPHPRRRLRRPLGRHRRRLPRRRRRQRRRHFHLHHRHGRQRRPRPRRLRRRPRLASIPPSPASKPASPPSATSSTPSPAAPAPTSRELSEGLDNYRAGQTGLLRLTWDNGDRTVLVNPELGGVTLGWNLIHTAQDELFAAIEGTAFHTRIILERMAEHGVPIDRVINAGGIPQNNAVLNQVYANVLSKPVLVPAGVAHQPRLRHLRHARRRHLPHRSKPPSKSCAPSTASSLPDPKSAAVYEKLYPLYRRVYFAFGDEGVTSALGDILRSLRDIAAEVRAQA